VVAVVIVKNIRGLIWGVLTRSSYLCTLPEVELAPTERLSKGVFLLHILTHPHKSHLSTTDPAPLECWNTPVCTVFVFKLIALPNSQFCLCVYSCKNYANLRTFRQLFLIACMLAILFQYAHLIDNAASSTAKRVFKEVNRRPDTSSSAIDGVL
jgi:hypothetical protein